MSIYHPYSIFPLGDSALTIDFGNVISEDINKKVLRLYQQVKESSLPYIDLIPAYSSLTIYYKVYTIYQNRTDDRTAFEIMAEKVETLTQKQTNYIEPISRKIEVPVCYAEKFALDIEYIASQKNIAVREIIKMHTSQSYRVYMIGFLPGFAYMGEVDERIAISRRSKPRTNVEAGSVGIAGKQTGIYPLSSPGGWQIIGKTPIKIFDQHNEEPVLFQPGDEVKFYSITEDEFENYQSRHS